MEECEGEGACIPKFRREGTIFSRVQEPNKPEAIYRHLDVFPPAK